MYMIIKINLSISNIQMEGRCKITAKQAISKRVGEMQIKEATFFIPPLSCNPFLALLSLFFCIICSDFKPFTNLSYMYMSMGLPELCYK